MKINLEGNMIERPKDMSIMEDLAWDYFAMNNGGWIAVQVGDGAILVTDESGDLESGFFCPDEDAFVGWLSEVAEDHVKNGEGLAEFLMAARWVYPCFFDETQVGAENVEAIERAIMAAIKYNNESRKIN